MSRLEIVRLTLAVFLAVALPCGALADSLRCEGGIVGIGDTRVDLLGKCGAPTFQDGRRNARADIAWDGDRGAGASRQVDAAIEVWTYDRGPDEFVQTVTICNGRVRSVDRGSYGRESDHARREARSRVSRCDGRFREGDAKYELLARCGEPASRDVWEERRGEFVLVGGTEQAVGGWFTVIHEVWTYNFGPNRFQQLVVLENGRVTRVDSGGYGYAE
jgi:hypothetical protein